MKSGAGMYSKEPSALSVKDTAWLGPVISVAIKSDAGVSISLSFAKTPRAGTLSNVFSLRLVKVIASNGIVVHLDYRNRHRSWIAVGGTVVGFIGETIGADEIESRGVDERSVSVQCEAFRVRRTGDQQSSYCALGIVPIVVVSE